MSMPSYVKRLILWYGGAFVFGMVWGAIKWYFSPNERRGDIGDIAEFRAMTNLNKTCRACIYERRICLRGQECSYVILCLIVDFLDSATESIDAAIYLITVAELKNAFIRAHKRGVHVRFISDTEMSGARGSAIPSLREAGIEVRVASPEERHTMHRKSVVVDAKCVLAGTANWTMQALCGNWDGFVKINDPAFVAQFVRAFEVEWDGMTPGNTEPLDQ